LDNTLGGEDLARTSEYDKLIEATGGDTDLAGELIDIFVTDYPRMLTEAQKALEDQHVEVLHRVAHTFKGNLRFMGAEAAAETALTIESMTVSRDLTDAGQALHHLKQQLEALEQGLIAHRKGQCLDESSHG
jgi:two-component system, sensor histidine kinase and response regulator